MPTSPSPRKGFRPSQLLYDARYRSITIQMIALALLLGTLYWLGSNVVHNLTQLGKEFSFSFLTQPSDLDISQKLIPYESSDTTLRAFAVGIANTILIAVLGCSLATVLGVVMGVLRLSKNWIVSRLAAVYVEGMRNVPLLLWILLCLALFSESLPHPRDFGKDGGPDMLFGLIAMTRQGTFIPAPVWEAGSGIMLAVFALSVVGLFAYRRYARKVQMQTGRQLPVALVGLGLLIVPVTLAYFLLGQPVALDVPQTGRFKFTGGIHVRNSFLALWLALSLYTAAFIAEIVRGGIMAINKGQSEAAAALGLRSGRAMRLVILPQAMRVIVPPLISQYLNLTKNSSLAVAATYVDITQVVNVTSNKNGRELESMLLLGIIYLVISLLISTVMNLYNNRIKLKER